MLNGQLGVIIVDNVRRVWDEEGNEGRRKDQPTFSGPGVSQPIIIDPPHWVSSTTG
jgi:hypothetical protein